MNAIEQEPSTVLSVEEMARELGIGRGTAYDAVRRGVVPSIRLNPRGKILIPRAALERWLSQQS